MTTINIYRFTLPGISLGVSEPTFLSVVFATPFDRDDSSFLMVVPFLFSFLSLISLAFSFSSFCCSICDPFPESVVPIVGDVLSSVLFCGCFFAGSESTNYYIMALNLLFF